MEAALFRTAAAAALDLFVRPAYVLDGGHVLLANEEGALLLRVDPVRTLACIRAAQRGAKNDLGLLARGPLVYTPRAHCVDAFAARLCLSGREKQVLETIVCGASNRGIAHQLRIAEVTVENHVTSIFRKAKVRSRPALLAAVIRYAAGP